MGYWKIRTEGPSRDSTYDNLPLFLGFFPDNGPPEELIASDTAAGALFALAGSSTVDTLKAQLLAAKLNAMKFAGFAGAQLPNGTKVSSVMAEGDHILDDIASGIPRQNSEIEATKDLLDAANNNGPVPTLFLDIDDCIIPAATATATPTPSPTVAGAAAGPTVTPSRLPGAGGLPAGAPSWPWVSGFVVLLLGLGGLGLAVSRRRNG